MSKGTSESVGGAATGEMDGDGGSEIDVGGAAMGEVDGGTAFDGGNHARGPTAGDGVGT